MAKFRVGGLLASTFLASATLMSTAAVAQTVSPSDQSAPAASTSGQDAASGSDVVVTGSRVARPNAMSPSPITTVGSEDIKEFGATKIEDLTNSLPQVFAGQSSGVSNGADGTATVDLRGLGPSRTLVLIDGRRLMPGNVGGGAGADLNFIPAALVSSVDLMTGGASSTYGADAVAGVVNFKMNRSFRGLRLDGQYSFFDHNNDNPIQKIVNQRYTSPSGHTAHGGAYDVTMALGTGVNDDRGNIVAYAGYREESAVTQDKYDYSVCTFNPDSNNVGLACGGSGTPAIARFGGFSAANRTLAGLPAASSYLLTNNGLRAYSALTDAYNFGPLNYYRRPSKRYTAGAFADYEISKEIHPYLDVMFADYSTQAQIAPSGAFYGTRTVNCDNPLLQQNAQLATAACGANVGVAGTSAQILIGKRNTEGGARFNDIGYNQFRIVTGVRGELGEAWSYDAYYQFGQIKAANVYRNDVSNARINNALNVVNRNGVPTCVSVINGSDPSCVPYNVFVPNGVSQAAANYINIPLVLTGTTKEQVLNGAVTGNLGAYGIQSPFAEDGLRIAGGLEWRKESLATQPDQAYINGDGAGQGGPTLPISGSYTVFDIFGEAGVPLVTDKPFFQDLSLTLGYRHSKYNVPGATRQNSADTYKIAGNWSPIRDITLRGSYNRAVRSPNIGELFLNQSQGLFAGSDPCAGTASNGRVNGYTAQQCALTGVTSAQFGNLTPNSAQQYNQYSGGNPNLMPEKADTVSAGILFTPKSFLRNLVLSVDYYRIKVNNAIGTIGAQVILNQCLTTGDAAFCSKINRAPSSAGPAAGSLWLSPTGYVNNLTTNTGSLTTSGLEVNGDYRATFGSGWKARWQFVGVYLDKYVAQPITNGFTYDCAGLYGLTCGNPNPRFRFNTNVKFTTPDDFGVTFRWRFLSHSYVDTDSPNPNLNSPGAAPTTDHRIGDYSYFDLLFSLPVKDSVTFRIGVNNLLDKDPPIISQASLGGFGNGNSFPGTYDTLGRTVFVNLTADF
ncbi:iron complex outermembrane receptor protein [Sphingomonas sp. SORGH_AS 950]|uniref:TonB-dependent receptor plug domain-containing protein n=1 Tax=Sphingomonas sp. SORGH_AS_0950 TaxID=3041792 RepID=UPI002787491F|nr:TonB-dependent receptor [Sphingomonas sp. SORGH_AS_0950]MDQ1157652.1 iron complex outermembrane receptor protein [Sphingomonas sp. SORGH_AS_0950]